MKLSNRLFDVLKWVAIIGLPAVQGFWLTLGDIWGLPYTVQIGATIAAVAVFLGALLGVSTYAYKRASGVEQTTFNSDAITEMMDYEDTKDTTEK